MDDSTDHREPRRDLLAFDRTDRRGLVALLGLLALGALLVWVVAPLRDWLAGAGIPLALVSPVSVPELDAAGVDHGLAITTTCSSLTRPPDSGSSPWRQGLLAAALLLVGCWFVLRVMRASPRVTLRTAQRHPPAGRRGDPRDRRPRGLLPRHGGARRPARLDGPRGWSRRLFLSIPWQAVVAGMVVALLAEAFRAGSRLRDDVAGLV